MGKSLSMRKADGLKEAGFMTTVQGQSEQLRVKLTIR